MTRRGAVPPPEQGAGQKPKRRGINRRTFIATSAGGVALVSDVALGEEAAPDVQVTRDEIVVTPGGVGGDADRWRLRADSLEGVAFQRVTIAGGWRIDFNRRDLFQVPQYAETDLSARFAIAIVERNGAWLVRVQWRDAVLIEAAPLRAWCRGDPLPVRVQLPGFRLDKLKVARADASGTLDSRLAFALRAAPGSSFGFEIDGQRRGAAARLEITPTKQFSMVAADALGNASARAGTRTVLDEVALDIAGAERAMDKLWRDQGGAIGRALVRAHAENRAGALWPVARLDQQLALLRPAEPRVIVESFEARRDHSIVILESAAAARLLLADAEGVRRLRLAPGARHAWATDRAASPPFASRLGAALDSAPHAVAGRGFSAQVRGGDAVTQTLQDGLIDRIELRAQALSLHWMTRDGARCDLDLRVPVDGAPARLDSAAIRAVDRRFGGLPVTITIGGPPGDTDGGDRLHLGRGGGAKLGLSFTGEPLHRLRLRRHLDGLDLSFAFDDHRLNIADGQATLVPGPAALRVARFWPQHLQEEAFTDPVPRGLMGWASNVIGGSPFASPTPASAPVPRMLGETASFGDPAAGRRTLLARTRMAGESRIAFAPAAAGGVPIPVTVEALTDWEGLTLRTPPRAQGDLPIDAQITDVARLTPAMSRRPAIAALQNGLMPPDRKETALELVTGLVFAPDDSARFRVPRTTPAGTTARLWSAQIELAPLGAASSAPARVRAVWSRGFEAARRIGGTGAGSDANAPFVSSLSADDRDEIMMLSSVFGMAALRAVTLRGSDNANSLVRLPSGPFCYISQDKRALPGAPPPAPMVQQEGVYSPAPFAHFDARLTAFGADLDLEWKGEPPGKWQPVNGDPAFPTPALKVERYLHRANLGSDVYVEVVSKGFLFPHGFRVSLIKITEREQHRVDELGWVMPLVQRYFILPKNQTRTYGPPFTPFDGLEIPMRWAKLVQRLSPEIEDPTRAPCPFDDIPPAGSPCGRVFWPKARGQTRPLAFEFHADDISVPRSAPMIFVDNAAAHEAQLMRRLVEDYNKAFDTDTAGRWRMTEQHHGGRTIFAASNRDGETSFPTSHLLLGARGRLIADPDTGQPVESFQMDAFMEGEDQPPFFPVMREAEIRVEQVDRLLQQPQRYRRVGYDATYIRHGFDRAANPGELYLRFLDPDGLMQVAGKGNMSGGFVQTPTPLAGISRINAVVGGTLLEPKAPPPPRAGAPGTAPPPPPPPPPSPTVAVGSDRQSPWNLEAVKSGAFEPSRYFKLGKLLGILDLGKVIQATGIAHQPKLVETIDYAEGMIEGAASTIKARLQDAADALLTALNAAEAKVASTLPGLPPGPEARYPSLSSLYPGLTASLERLRIALGDLSRLEPTSAEFVKATTALVSQWGPLKREIDRIAGNPMPAVVADKLALLRTAIKDAEDAIRAQLNVFANAVLGAVRTEITTLFVDKIVDAGLFELAFAATDLARSVPNEPPSSDDLRAYARRLIAKPAEIAQRARDALLGDGLIVPLLDMLIALDRVQEEVDRGSIERLASALADAAVKSLTAMLRATALRVAAAHGWPILCNVAGGSVPLLASVARAAKSPIPRLVDAIGKAQQTLAPLGLPGVLDSPEVAAVRGAAAGLNTAMQRLANDLLELKGICETLEASGTRTVCDNPVPLLEAVAAAFRVRLEALAAVQDCVRQAGEVEQALKVLAAGVAAEANKALNAVRHQLAILGQGLTLLSNPPDWADVVRAITQVAASDPATKARLTQAQAHLAEARATIAQFTAHIQTGIGEVEHAVLAGLADAAAELARRERALLFAVLDGAIKANEVLEQIEHTALKPLRLLCPALIQLHTAIETQIERATGLVTDPGSDVLRLLAGPTLVRLGDARTAVADDRAALDTLGRNLGTAALAVAQLNSLMERWRSQGPGILRAARVIAELMRAVALGKLGDLIDLAAARRVIEEAIERLVPTSITLNYSWDAKLGPYPPSSPIFIIPPSSSIPANDPPTNDLEISTKIVVDLIKPGGRKVEVTGRMKPFTIHLLGSTVDLLKVHFANGKFEIRNGGSPKFTVDVYSVELGQALQFLKKLSEYLGGDSGIFIRPTFAPLGIEVGYRFASEIIPMGTLTFLNVSFSTWLLLPFADQPALLGVAVGTRELPLRIVATPYIGGGFVSLLANARGIVAFEILLEFGAAVALNFSPLRAWGFVSAGFYLFARADGTRVFEGFIHAIGEGSIACFGVTVNIEVLMRQEKGSGSMNGKSTYKFTFRVGFASVSYRFEARYRVKGSAPGAALRDLTPNPHGPPTLPHATVLPDKTCWEIYRRHFAGKWI